MKELTDMDIEVITEYEQTLIGNQQVIDPYYFTNRTPEANTHTALMLIKYCCEKYWKWSPQKLLSSLDMDLLKKWKLAGLVRYIEFPTELNKERNINYIARMIYPDKISVSDKDTCLLIYQQIEDGVLKKYPKGFFSGSNGMNRVCYCLKYAIDSKCNFTSVEELYEYFGTSRCLKFLRDSRLATYIKEMFDCPITAMHILVPAEQDIEFLFQYYRFWQIFDEDRRQEGEQRGRSAQHHHAKLSKEDQKYVQIDF